MSKSNPFDTNDPFSGFADTGNLLTDSLNQSAFGKLPPLIGFGGNDTSQQDQQQQPQKNGGNNPLDLIKGLLGSGGGSDAAAGAATDAGAADAGAAAAGGSSLGGGILSMLAALFI